MSTAIRYYSCFRHVGGNNKVRGNGGNGVATLLRAMFLQLFDASASRLLFTP